MNLKQITSYYEEALKYCNHTVSKNKIIKELELYKNILSQVIYIESKGDE